MASLSARLVKGFAELRRRRVFRVAAAYAVGAWVLLQIADVVFPAVGLSESMLSSLVMVLGFGFPVAILLGWRYDLGSEGLVRTKPATSGELTLQKSDYFVLTGLGLITIAAGLGIYSHVDKQPTVIPWNAGAPVLAVLPLSNLSGNPDNEYFADGLTEELQNVLGKLDGLRVIGRTSSFSFKGQNVDLRKVGEALRANYLLQGTVRQSNDTLRVTAKLIETKDAIQVWEETYDRELGDVFAIQTSIAQAVVKELRVPLFETNTIKVNAAKNFQAYDRYLAGKANVRLRSLEGVNKGIGLYKEAIALDSEFVPAYAGLALAYLRLHVNYRQMGFDEAFGQAESAIQSALLMDPDSADAHSALAVLKQWTWQLTDRDELKRDTADQAYLSALAKNPNDADTNKFYSSFLVNTGKYYAAIEYAKRSLEIDPLAPGANATLGACYDLIGDFEQAEQHYLQEKQMNPESASGYKGLASLSVNVRGDLVEAVGLMETVVLDLGQSGYQGWLARLWLDLGAYEEAELIYDQIRNENTQARWEERLYLEDYENAFQILKAQLDLQSKPTRVHYMFPGRVAAFAGDHDTAVNLLVNSDPRFLTKNIVISSSNFEDAFCLAYSLQKVDRDKDADNILAALLTYFKSTPRMGAQGYGFADTHVYALMGDEEKALDAFEDAITAGVRSTWFAERWPRPQRDPTLEALHEHPRFQSLVALMDSDLARQRTVLLDRQEKN